MSTSRHRRVKLGAGETASVSLTRRVSVAGDTATGPLGLSDAHLAAKAATDSTAFAEIYLRYGAALHAFCLKLLRDPDAAADCVQDTFLIAATHLGQLHEHDKLRTWLYAIARREVWRRSRNQRREHLPGELPDAVADLEDPEHGIAERERVELVAAAAAGLKPRDRTVLELHYNHGFDGQALADALGTSPSNAYALVARLRTTVERSIGALLVARHRQQQACPELDTLLDGWDGTLTVLLRKRIARHIEHCAPCTQTRNRLVNPRALLASAPLAIPAPHWIADHIARSAEPILGTAAPGASQAPGPAATGTGHAAASGAPGGGTHAVAASWWPAGIGTSTSTIVAVIAPVAAIAAVVPVVVVALNSAPAALSPAPVLAAPALALPSTTSASRRFALDPSITRLDPTRERPTATSRTLPTGAAPDGARPGQQGPSVAGGAGPEPGNPGAQPSGAPRRNGIGVPVIPRRPVPSVAPSSDPSVSATKPPPVTGPAGPSATPFTPN